jgi:uncharacterized protein
VDIPGRRILVTGASGGLGAAIARELARRNADLVLSGRNRAALESLAVETGGEVLVADLCDRADVDRLTDEVKGFDVLVLNAGTGGDPPLPQVEPADVDASIDTNLRAPMLMSLAFAQHHVTEGRPGALVLIGSLSGLSPTPNTRLYNATKFGLRGFSLAIRQDLDGTGVTVTHVAPGFIRDAGMFASSGMELPPGVRTKAPRDVAMGVVRAIESGPAEIFVSPTELRLGATFAGLAPGLSAALLKRTGAADRKAASTDRD